MEKANEERIKIMLPLLNEKQKRLFLASEAKALGYGGISQISRVSGVSRVTISQGIKKLSAASDETLNTDRSRKKGGGRHKTEKS